MDSNRRHKLAQNDLARQYEEWIKPNLQWISWAFIAVLLLIAVGVGYSKLLQSNKAAAWKMYYSALSTENATVALETVANSTGEAAGLQARLSLGQLLLAEACVDAMSNKTDAVEKLEKAIIQFRKVKESKASAELKQEAAWGIGQTFETLASLRSGQEDMEQAVQEYKSLAERWPNSFLGEKAAKQSVFISRSDTKKFFEWSVAQAEKKPDADDFKTEIDENNPFPQGPGGLDLEKSFGEGFAAPKTETVIELKGAETEEKPAVEEKPETEAKPEAKPVTEDQAVAEPEREETESEEMKNEEK